MCGKDVADVGAIEYVLECGEDPDPDCWARITWNEPIWRYR